MLAATVAPMLRRAVRRLLQGSLVRSLGEPSVSTFPRADAVVLLGAPIDSSGRPSDLLQARLDTAQRLIADGNSEVLIVTGGHMPNGFEAHDVELRGPATFLQNLPGNVRLIVDRGSRRTAESARWIAARLSPGSQVLLVTQPFHGPRSELLFTRAGLRPTVVPASDAALVERPMRALRFVVRERLAVARALMTAR